MYNICIICIIFDAYFENNIDSISFKSPNNKCYLWANGVLRITMTGNNEKLPPTYVAIEEPGNESCNSDLPDLLACGEDGYLGWCCLGWLFSLPTAFCMSRKMKENKPWLKYGIPGTLKI